MAKLSVNINKIATLRNSRGGDNPNVVEVAKDCERFGAQGITVHPRPDERHIRAKDVYDLAKVVTTEFNIEGYPDERFVKMVEDVKPTQATLVPDPPNVLTSNAGWDTLKNASFLNEIVSHLKSIGVRTSIFIDPKNEMMEGAKACGTDRVELYTEMYASAYHSGPQEAVRRYKESADFADELGLEINAGHDLDLMNLNYFIHSIPFTKEVSIGHALISNAIYLGLENTIQLYLRELDLDLKQAKN